MKWSALNTFGKSRLFATSYVWLVIVPFAAKFLAAVESPLDLSEHVPGLVLHLELPFSWQRFYMSALLVAAGHSFYFLCCPPIIRRYPGFSEFEADGHDSFFYLRAYVERYGLMHISELDAGPSTSASRDQVARDFWKVYASADSSRLPMRMVCTVFFLAGSFLLAIVICENVVFAFRKMPHFDAFELFYPF